MAVDSPEVRVKTTNESVLLGDSACVEVYQGDRLVAKVMATIKTQKGADSGLYPAVEFEEVEYPEQDPSAP